MELLFFVGIILILLFAGVVAFGAPYLPTLSTRVDDAIELLDLKPGQTFLELGSGDGRLLKEAARREIKSVGYELNPLLVLYTYISCWRYRRLVTVKWGNYWNKDWPEADAMYVFLLKPYMSKLHNKIVQYTNGKSFRVVSFAFKIEEKKPIKEKQGMHVYQYGNRK